MAVKTQTAGCEVAAQALRKDRLMAAERLGRHLKPRKGLQDLIPKLVMM
jgi:hypothetical protein